jgi:hypothetical protein
MSIIEGPGPVLEEKDQDVVLDILTVLTQPFAPYADNRGMPRRHHEHRVIALLQTVLGPDALASEVAVPRAAHAIDCVLRLEQPTDLWGPLGPLVAHRTVVIEHESRGPSRMRVHSATAKVTWIAWDEHVRKVDRGRRPPLLLFLSAGCPGWVAAGELGFWPTGWPGVFRMSWGLQPEVVLVHLRGLPDAPGMSLLKLMPTPRDDSESSAAIRRLKEDPSMLQSTKDRVLEAIMNHSIPATSKERWITLEDIRRETRLEERLEIARRLLARGTPIAEVCGLIDLDETQVRALLP